MKQPNFWCRNAKGRCYLFTYFSELYLAPIIIFDNMKTILITLSILLLALAQNNDYAQSPMTINLGKTYLGQANQEAFTLLCHGANGRVTFLVDGLPSGTYLDGDRIIIGNNTNSGNYILRIRATDASGQVA